MKDQHKDNSDLPPKEDEQLIDLIMPPGNEGEPAPKGKRADKSEDDEVLDSKAAHRKLLETFTDDEGEKSEFNIFPIINGEILSAKWFRRHILWLVMLVALAFLYVSNRYYAQEQMIRNNRLKEELKEVHYNAMARSSELMRNCRRSTIMEQLEANPQNTLMPSDKQPAVIEEDN